MAPERSSERRADAVLGLVMLAIAAITWWEARKLPPAPFDPLGPKTFPIWLSYVLAGLALVLLARLALGLRIGQSTTSLVLGVGGDAPAEYRLRPGLAVFAFAWTVAYTAVLTFAPVSFLYPTIAYMAGLGWAMSDRSLRQAAIAAAVAVIGGAAIHFMFTRIFVVALP
jgi:hypothetical protein